MIKKDFKTFGVEIGPGIQYREMMQAFLANGGIELSQDTDTESFIDQMAQRRWSINSKETREVKFSNNIHYQIADTRLSDGGLISIFF